MCRYNLDILGISECRWTGSGRQRTSDGSVILYSGNDTTHTNGVALIVAKKYVNTLLEWEPISDRLLRARFDSKHCKLTIIQCYAPKNEADDEAKDDWYDHLTQVISRVPRHDMLLVIGDLNAKVGTDNTNYERAMGVYGCSTMNNNSELLADFCLNNDLVIGGTIFPHKNIHKLTWRSPDGRTLNQIDHIIINGKWRRSLLNVRVYRGADASSDHNLVVTSVKLKLRKVKKQVQQRKQLDAVKLKCPKIQKQFVLEVKNRFQALADNAEDTPVETRWNKIKSVYNEAAVDIIGYKKKNSKQWLSPETWKKIDERK
ncbi:craniofacial development protein 2-like [Nematostella vectensis]|uniref:craniofacial development protein 2-like n=1 Tax=Nematostella vectensis TaxID=45351 RepID=UPI002076E5A4|nr:craniofacial development protein 2-like [Nematostella vectensis]